MHWRSEQEIEVLNYNSNFSNWTGLSPVPGYFLFEVKKEDEVSIAQVKIPVAGNGGIGHYSIIEGRYEKGEKEIKVWQNEEIPVRIKYKRKSDSLFLVLFGKKIKFKRVENIHK